MAWRCDSVFQAKAQPSDSEKKSSLWGETVETNPTYKESLIYGRRLLTVSQFMRAFRVVLGRFTALLPLEMAENDPRNRLKVVRL